jgi:hypothetical protein
MMASGREKREKAGEKLKDIIESLKGPKATKTDIETSNDSATASESLLWPMNSLSADVAAFLNFLFLPRFFFVVLPSYAPFLNVAILFLNPVSHLNHLECLLFTTWHSRVLLAKPAASKHLFVSYSF